MYSGLNFFQSHIHTNNNFEIEIHSNQNCLNYGKNMIEHTRTQLDTDPQPWKHEPTALPSEPAGLDLPVPRMSCYAYQDNKVERCNSHIVCKYFHFYPAFPYCWSDHTKSMQICDIHNPTARVNQHSAKEQPLCSKATRTMAHHPHCAPAGAKPKTPEVHIHF